MPTLTLVSPARQRTCPRASQCRLQVPRPRRPLPSLSVRRTTPRCKCTTFRTRTPMRVTMRRSSTARSGCTPRVRSITCSTSPRKGSRATCSGEGATLCALALHRIRPTPNRPRSSQLPTPMHMLCQTAKDNSVARSMQASRSIWNRYSRLNAPPSSCPVPSCLRPGLLIPLILLLAPRFRLSRIMFVDYRASPCSTVSSHSLSVYRKIVKLESVDYGSWMPAFHLCRRMLYVSCWVFLLGICTPSG